MKHNSDLLNIYQAAGLLQIPPAALYQLASSGIIPAKKKKRAFEISRPTLIGWARMWRERLRPVEEKMGVEI